MSPVTGMHYALGSYETFQPSFRDEKRSTILVTRSGAKFGKKSKHGETKIVTYWPIIARVTLKAVYITAVKWDAYDMENTAGNARRCYPERQNSSRCSSR